jgi:dTDP-4-dehydrorhamnose 3,5-epimerase
MNFIFERQSIPDVILIRRAIYVDQRGSFAESYKKSAFHDAGLSHDFVQDNIVSSSANVLRGLHYQLDPMAQGKLVAVIRGRILDVAVDIRPRQASFGKWVAATLTDTGGEMLWVPPGFAHGYLVLSDSADVQYKVTAEYEPALDRGIRWNDPTIGIPWPTESPVLSDKDRDLPALVDAAL